MPIFSVIPATGPERRGGSAGRLAIGPARRPLVHEKTREAMRVEQGGYGRFADGRFVGPVFSVSPLAFTTADDPTVAVMSARGGSTGEPRGSRQTPAACQRRPSGPRTNTHGENLAPGGASTHRPGSQPHRARDRAHSPSTQTADLLGRSGTASTLAGGGEKLTSTSAFCGCGL